jgi:FkbM family methyltransferase
MKQLLKKIIPTRGLVMIQKARARYLDPFYNKSYSQEGEDMVLRRLLERRTGPGFYVDVGAHHPRRFSNTYYFYKRGWRGVNIDATPGVKRLFDRERPRDTTVEAAISRDGRELTLRVYPDGALNSLSTDAADAPAAAHAGVVAVREVKLSTRRLVDVLREHVPAGQSIDYMSVDVEGMDLEVLEGGDWDAYRPRFVLVECFGARLSEVDASPVGAFMRARGYEVFAKCVHTFIFRDTRAADAGANA